MAMYIRYKNYMHGRDLIDWNIKEYCGYEPQTTYYTDFGIAEWYGIDAVRDTYKRAMQSWKKNIEWVTEIAMVLNWKIHEHYQRNDRLCDVYTELYKDADEYVRTHFEGDELRYYYRTTD